MESIQSDLYEDNLEYLVRLGYIKIHPDENGVLMMTLSPEGRQWVEENGELQAKKTDRDVCSAFIYIILTHSHSSTITVLWRPREPEVPKKERRSSLRVKTERKFYRPGGGVDGKWVGNPTSPSEEANLDPKLHGWIQDVEFTVVKPMDARQLDAKETTKNDLGGIVCAKGGEKEPVVKSDHGMYVDNLEYDSDVTREMTEEEVFEYERVIETVEENKEGHETVVETVEDDDEDDEVL
jgi:hypothetical protein